jgi:hypothetical protein
MTARQQQLGIMREIHRIMQTYLLSKHGETGEKRPIPDGALTESNWFWAYGQVLNRAVELPWRGNVTKLAVVPLLDVLNHANAPACTAELVYRWGGEGEREGQGEGESEGRGGGGAGVERGQESRVDVVLARNVRAGEEITVSFGAFSSTSHEHAPPQQQLEAGPERPLHSGGLSNTQLLVHYGFAVPVNTHEVVALDAGLGAEPDDAALPLKRTIIEQNSLDTSALVNTTGELPPLFLQALRTKHLSDMDLRVLERFKYDFHPRNGFFSLQNELKVHLLLVSSLEDLLKTYPTTLRQDQSLGQSLLQAASYRPAEQNMHHVHAYHAGIKRVVHFIILRSLATIQALFSKLADRWGVVCVCVCVCVCV